MTKLKFVKNLSQVKFDFDNYLFIYDQRLLKNKILASWIKQKPLKYGVQAGEKLKNLSSFEKHLKKISKLLQSKSPKQITIVAMGGGSVGDFAGFFASIYKRGVGFVQIPTTWLAAMDSAHGGKNALNVDHVKNQIGTFYFPKEVVLVKEILTTQPTIRTDEAFGEYFKMALLDKNLWQKSLKLKSYSALSLWKILPDVIQAKYKVVHLDPYEQKGHRQILNLGHTLGHVLESYYGLAHGIAVNMGLVFALRWSLHRDYLSENHYRQLLKHPLIGKLKFSIQYFPENQKQVKKYENLFLADKKRETQQRVQFIFIKKPGEVFREPILAKDLLQELQRQKNVQGFQSFYEKG